MSCKKTIRIKICIENSCTTMKATLHPRGCMRASRTHIDVPEKEAPPLLREIAEQRGLHLDYMTIGDCIVAYSYGLPELYICNAPRPESRRILIRRLKRGHIYIGL